MSAIAGVQSSRDLRNLPINQVGIKDLRFPITLNTAEGSRSTVAHLIMIVFLSAGQKGTRVLRLVALMEQQTEALDFDRLHKLTAEMVAFLDSHSGKTGVSFPSSRKKSVPVSGIQSLLDYDVTLTGEIKNGTYSHSLKIVIPVVSLCPCSREIFQYGTHNQRPHVTVSLTANAEVGIEEIIDCVEAQASCQLYGLLKRFDGKYVTEKVYENPEFVEGMVCDAATALIADGRIEGFIVESESFESMHNHPAYAYIACPQADSCCREIEQHPKQNHTKPHR